MEQDVSTRPLCEICGKTFNSVNILKRHIYEFHVRSVEDDPNTDKNVQKQKVERDISTRPLCEICGKTFNGVNILKRHINEFHVRSVEDDPNTDQNVKKEKFTCVLCHKTFGRKHDLQRHININHLSMSDNLRLHKCQKCSYSTPHKSAFNRHNMTVHVGDKGDNKTKKCVHCDRSFSTNSCLTRHVRAKHEHNVEGRKIFEVQQSTNEKVTCDLCDKQYFRKTDLQRHINIVHLSSSGNSQSNKCPQCTFTTRYKTALNRHIMTKHNVTSQDTLQCEYCISTFKNKHTLEYHLKKYHTSDTLDQPVFKRKCCICSKALYGYRLEALRSHFEKAHNISMEWKSFSFSSMTDFDTWKRSVEKETTSSYVLSYAREPVKVYKCHRSGKYTKKGLNKRALKMAGSCKINNTCPSVIKVTKQKNGFSVKYLPSHVGHENELKYIRLAPEEREFIAKSLVEKIPRDVVLNSLKESVTNGDLLRIHLTSKKDIINIEQSLDFKEKALKHPFDIVGIKARVTELESSNDTALIAYKPQGEILNDFPHINKENFLLIFMSEAQKTILKKCGQDIICVDRTQGTNSNNFQLYTLLTVDETMEGLPVAFMFTDKADECTLLTFFEHLERVTGPIHCNIFMSDMEETCYNAWKKVMGLPNARLYCTWYMLNAWQVSLFNKIMNKESRDITRKMLQTVLYELDETAFVKSLQSLLARLTNSRDKQLFGDYFQKQYVDNERFKTWAHCYRMNAGTNTNISLENFSRVLKHFHKLEEKDQPLEKTLCAILTLLKDKLLDLLIKKNRRKVVRKLQLMRISHRTSLSLNLNSVSQLDVQRWQVLSSKGSDLYTVQKITKCNKCSLRCTHCDTCLHEFVCSCIDNSLRSNMCKHIHLVMRSAIGDGHRQEEPNDDIEDGNYDEDTPDIQNSILMEVTENLYEDFESNKKCIAEDFHAYIMNNIKTPDQLEYCKEMYKTLSSKIDTMNADSSRPIEELNTYLWKY